MLVQKIQQNKIDTISHVLVAAKGCAADLHQKIAQMGSDLTAEMAHLTLESAPYIANYIGAVRKSQAFLREELLQQEAEITEMEEHLLQHIQRKKFVGVPVKRIIEEIAREELKLEVSELDEFAQSQFIRSKWSN